MDTLDGDAINSKLTYNFSASSLEQVCLAAFYPEHQTLGGVTVDLAEYSLPQDCAKMAEIVFALCAPGCGPGGPPMDPYGALGLGAAGGRDRP